MIERLIELDTKLFRWINGHYCTAMDWVMWSASQKWCWLAVIATAIILFTFEKISFKPFTVRVAKDWWIALAGVALCFLLADQGSVHLFKETVCRLRPCHALDGVRMFRTHCGGQYGFVSSHAANALAEVVFLCLMFKHSKTHSKGITCAALILMTVWAVTNCYSRAYLGKHYPGDIVCGALFGILIGLIVWWFAKILKKKLHIGETK